MWRISPVITIPMIGSMIRHPEGDDERGQDHPAADNRIAAGVLTVGDERRAVESPAGHQANARRDRVPEHPNEACRWQCKEVLGR
jgi:hypothetical protein